MSAAYLANLNQVSDIKDHLPRLYEVARGNVMEIGVRGGVSTSALLAGVEAHGGHLWSFDINPCQVFDSPHWSFVQADSIAEAERIKGIIPDELELLLVDGDHSYEGCLSDLRNYGPRARVIMIHDCECPETYPGVRIAAEEYAASIGKRLVVHPGSYGMGEIVCYDISKSLTIDGWMTDTELRWIARAAGRCASVVEVGCYQGRTTRTLADNAAGTVYAVDDWRGLREEWWVHDTPEDVRSTLFERFSRNLSDVIGSGKVKVLKEDHAKFDEIPEIPAADLVFIDGSHVYADVKRDITNWLPFLNPGGIMCGHDSHQQPVWQAVTEMLPGAVKTEGYIWKWENK